jgi:PAP_fibrillin
MRHLLLLLYRPQALARWRKTHARTRAAPPLLALNSLSDLLASIPNPNAAATSSARSSSKVRQLKTELLQACSSIGGGGRTNKERDTIESLINELAPLPPTTATASSPKLQKCWKVLWTTEKAINFFLENGLSTEITQTITAEGKLENVIPFVRGEGGASFEVARTVSALDRAGVRTNFAFTSAVLDLGRKWGTYRLPPVGSGWFDTLYLDVELRIDRNSRNDILSCTAADAAAAL